jgi:hypothetical protein
MSRKTIVFRMPAADAPRASDGNVDPVAPSDERSPAITSEVVAASETPDASEPERWVRLRDLDTAPEPEPVGFPASPAFAAAGWSLHVDLAAERNFSQIVALSVALPPMLGWFWAANAFDRYRRLFA